MKKILLSILLLIFYTFNLSAQQVTLSEQEVSELTSHIENLVKRDSINNLIIGELSKELGLTLPDPPSTTPPTAEGAETPTVSEPEQKITLKDRGGNNAHALGMTAFLLLAFGSGLISLLTPCVFPMIPMTVSFFTNASNTRGQAVKRGMLYGLSIVVIYGILGAILAPINGPEFAQVLSTHWLPNVIFFTVFIVFGLSFLGLFDITLPSSFVNKVDAQADRGGLIGVFFMAFTLVLVSFSCTGPIVGALLVEAAGENPMRPILGMIAYAAAFAIPFTLFAIFPGWLKALPKSGGWLNVVKVLLGFVELALAFKFLSIADQVYHWGILDREVYLAIWIIIAILMGVYLLGKIRLPHDSEVEKVSVPRLLLSMVCFVFAIYLFPGMFGAPLKPLSGYLPPMSTHDFDIPALVRQHQAGVQTEETDLCEEPIHGQRLHLPHGLKGYFDYEQALACAREKSQPLFIDFTGHGCVNCREMEANVWSDPEVLKMLSNDFMIVALYADDRTELDESQWYESPYDGKTKKTIGAVNRDFQLRTFGVQSQPYYVILDPFTEEILAQPIGYEREVESFIDFLKEGKDNFETLRNGN
ncbi:cytochrome c biogenesis protein CcdA [Cytophagaceae bacterium ABcell3]|nr:cytochrome c biogenesis protein CcdA [Cytophagaceae bacterium ABcell3]